MNRIEFEYDAVGRLVKDGSKTYRYGYLDKVMSVTDNGSTYTYDYHADGQLASANYGDSSESFAWDGLALIQRGDEQFVNEPHIGGGNPVASSKGTSYFNDMLGTTVGYKANGKYSAAVLSAFGEGADADKAFFTGKPMVEGLGHAFLMRNYRAGLAKWQTADPLGYPDGWNALAYCGNGVTSAVDLWGCKIVILGEVEWNGLHLASVWADCNEDYNNPSFAIKQGKLAFVPFQKIDGIPNYRYDNPSFSIGDRSYRVDNISFGKSSAIPDKESNPYNCCIQWEYKIKLMVTCSGKTTKIITDPENPENHISVDVPWTFTYEQQLEAVKGVYYIPE